jgi:hypothetical protein
VAPRRRQEVGGIGEFKSELSPDDDDEYPVESDQPDRHRRKHAKGIGHRSSSEDANRGDSGRLDEDSTALDARAPARPVGARLRKSKARLATSNFFGLSSDAIRGGNY